MKLFYLTEITKNIFISLVQVLFVLFGMITLVVTIFALINDKLRGHYPGSYPATITDYLFMFGLCLLFIGVPIFFKNQKR